MTSELDHFFESNPSRSTEIPPKVLSISPSSVARLGQSSGGRTMEMEIGKEEHTDIYKMLNRFLEAMGIFGSNLKTEKHFKVLLPTSPQIRLSGIADIFVPNGWVGEVKSRFSPENHIQAMITAIGIEELTKTTCGVFLLYYGGRGRNKYSYEVLPDEWRVRWEEPLLNLTMLAAKLRTADPSLNKKKKQSKIKVPHTLSMFEANAQEVKLSNVALVPLWNEYIESKRLLGAKIRNERWKQPTIISLF